MKSKISLITLGVQDIQKSKAFYKALGFEVHGEEKEDDIHVMFKMEGSWLSLFVKEKTAEGANIANDGSGFSGIVMAHNVASKEEVDSVMEEARAVGAEVTKEATDEFWGGYAGYFKDPDGYVWSVAWNPFTDLT